MMTTLVQRGAIRKAYAELVKQGITAKEAVSQIYRDKKLSWGLSKRKILRILQLKQSNAYGRRPKVAGQTEPTGQELLEIHQQDPITFGVKKCYVDRRGKEFHTSNLDVAQFPMLLTNRHKVIRFDTRADLERNALFRVIDNGTHIRTECRCRLSSGEWISSFKVDHNIWLKMGERWISLFESDPMSNSTYWGSVPALPALSVPAPTPPTQRTSMKKQKRQHRSRIETPTNLTDVRGIVRSGRLSINGVRNDPTNPKNLDVLHEVEKRLGQVTHFLSKMLSLPTEREDRAVLGGYARQEQRKNGEDRETTPEGALLILSPKDGGTVTVVRTLSGAKVPGTLISRDEAADQGLRRFYTGVPCKHGHDSERDVVYGSCCQCDKNGREEWEKANPEKMKTYKEKAAQKNKQKVQSYRDRIKAARGR